MVIKPCTVISIIADNLINIGHARAASVDT
jgi:hypothetical protein